MNSFKIYWSSSAFLSRKEQTEAFGMRVRFPQLWTPPVAFKADWSYDFFFNEFILAKLCFCESCQKLRLSAAFTLPLSKGWKSGQPIWDSRIGSISGSPSQHQFVIQRWDHIPCYIHHTVWIAVMSSSLTSKSHKLSTIAGAYSPCEITAYLN